MHGGRHVCEADSEHCDTGHSHLLCQLTRTLSSGIAAADLTDFPRASQASPNTPTATTRENRPILPGGKWSKGSSRSSSLLCFRILPNRLRHRGAIRPSRRDHLPVPA